MGEWMQHYRDFRKELILVGHYLIAAMRLELHEQGHVNTTKLNNSFELNELETADNIVLEIFAEHYSEPLETGVPSGSIKYTPFSGKKHSNYIEGLITWVETKLGITGVPAKRLAFAIAATHKVQGIPTLESAKKHPSGIVHWLTRTLDQSEPKLEHLTESAFEAFIDKATTTMFGNIQKERNNIK